MMDTLCRMRKLADSILLCDQVQLQINTTGFTLVHHDLSCLVCTEYSLLVSVIFSRNIEINIKTKMKQTRRLPVTYHTHTHTHTHTHNFLTRIIKIILDCRFYGKASAENYELKTNKICKNIPKSKSSKK